MEQRSRINIRTIVTVGLFATITFLGIQMFRIPLPAAVGTPFVHFGHIFVVLGVLLQGGKKGAVSGTIGLVVFDLLNGYVQAIPQVFVETIIKCLILGMIVEHFKVKDGKNEKQEYKGVVIGVLVYAMMNMVIEFVMGTITLLIMGSKMTAALLGSATSIPATVINAVFMTAVVLMIYKPVQRTYRKYSRLG